MATSRIFPLFFASMASTLMPVAAHAEQDRVQVLVREVLLRLELANGRHHLINKKKKNTKKKPKQ